MSKSCLCQKRKKPKTASKEEEEISPEEEERRYQIAKNGWAKVRKVMMAYRMQKKDVTMGNVQGGEGKKGLCSYERWVIDPKSVGKYWWNYFVSLLLVYEFVIIPFM